MEQADDQAREIAELRDRLSICAGFFCCPYWPNPETTGVQVAPEMVSSSPGTPRPCSAILSPVTVASRRSRSACSSLPRPGRPTPAA